MSQPLAREALCSWLDTVAESAKDAGIAICSVQIWIEEPDWPGICDLFNVAYERRTATVVSDTWQGVSVFAHRRAAATRAAKRKARSAA